MLNHWSIVFRIAHSTVPIQKPLLKSQVAVQREIEEAMKKVKEAQSLITAAIDYSGEFIRKKGI